MKFRGIFLILLLVFFYSRLEAQTGPYHMRDIFTCLPDSAFHYTLCPGDENVFSVHSRKSAIAIYDTSSGNVLSDYPSILDLDDSIGRMTFYASTDLECRTTLAVLRMDDKGLFFALESEECDEVGCHSMWNFYIFSNGSLKQFFHVLPALFPAKLFFDSTYLVQKHVDPNMDMSEDLDFSFGRNNRTIIVSANTQLFNPDIGDPQSPLCRLNSQKMKCGSLKLKLSGHKFVIAGSADNYN